MIGEGLDGLVGLVEGLGGLGLGLDDEGGVVPRGHGHQGRQRLEIARVHQGLMEVVRRPEEIETFTLASPFCFMPSVPEHRVVFHPRGHLSHVRQHHGAVVVLGRLSWGEHLLLLLLSLRVRLEEDVEAVEVAAIAAVAAVAASALAAGGQLHGRRDVGGVGGRGTELQVGRGGGGRLKGRERDFSNLI